MRLAEGYDALLFDLDGVLYRGDQAIPGAADALAELRSEGHRMAFCEQPADTRAGRETSWLHGFRRRPRS
jgi:beta-phosphoglucomutase-like phosphatase (HAD superfamily)